MTANEANKKIRALIAQGENKQAGQIWHDYVYGETQEIESQRSTRSIDIRFHKIISLSIFGTSQSRYTGSIQAL